MFVKLKKIFSFLLVLFLLTPSIVKLEHHHVQIVCSAKGENHFHAYHDKCAVCNFEFSIFLAGYFLETSVKAEFKDCYSNCYNSFPYSNFSKYSFSLRGSPVFTNIV